MWRIETTAYTSLDMWGPEDPASDGRTWTAPRPASLVRMQRKLIALSLVVVAGVAGCDGGPSQEEARSACLRTAREATEVVNGILQTMVTVFRGERANIGLVQVRLERVKRTAASCDEFREGTDSRMKACAQTVTLVRRAGGNFFSSLALAPPRNTRLIRAVFANTIPPALPSIRRASRTCSGQAPSPTP